MQSPKKKKRCPELNTKNGNPSTSSDDDIYPPPVVAIGASPWYLGKPRKLDSKEKRVLPLSNRFTKEPFEGDEIVIDDSEYVEPEIVPATPSPPPKSERRTMKEDKSEEQVPKMFNRKQKKTAYPLLDTPKATTTSFSSDPKLEGLKSALAFILAPGQTENTKDSEFHTRINKLASDAANEKPNEKIKRRQKIQDKRQLATVDDFKMANGGSLVKEMKCVVPEREPSGSETQKKSQVVPKKTSSYCAAFKKAMIMDFEGGGKDERVKGLRSEPSLKNFDEHVISLIESEIMSVSAEVGWADVAGLDGAKKALREIVVLPYRRPDVFKGIRAPPKGVLLFGPPGTGKTMIGKCVASQCRATFFNISASSLTSKWVGEGEKLVRALFAVARVKLPSVIFIDEVDSLLSSRSESEHESSRRIKTEFLVQLDGVATAQDERLLVIGATNRPQELDEAARRRFAKRLYIALPESEARMIIVQNLLGDMKHELDEVAFSRISSLTEGYSGADMRQLCAEASMGPIREIIDEIETIDKDAIRPISADDFFSAARVVRPTVDESQLDAYSAWDKKFGCLLYPTK